jgi:hypothetical protein
MSGGSEDIHEISVKIASLHRDSSAGLRKYIIQYYYINILLPFGTQESRGPVQFYVPLISFENGKYNLNSELFLLFYFDALCLNSWRGNEH